MHKRAKHQVGDCQDCQSGEVVPAMDCNASSVESGVEASMGPSWTTTTGCSVIVLLIAPCMGRS